MLGRSVLCGERFNVRGNVLEKSWVVLQPKLPDDGDGYVLRAIDRAGRPIVANALGIAVALTALWLSPLKIHAQVSTIMWVAILVLWQT